MSMLVSAMMMTMTATGSLYRGRRTKPYVEVHAALEQAVAMHITPSKGETVIHIVVHIQAFKPPH